MENRKRGSVFAFLAAACCSVELLFRIARFARDVKEYGARPNVVTVLVWTLLIGMIVTLVLRTRIGVMIAAAGFLLLNVYWLVLYHEEEWFWDLSAISAYAGLIVLLILSMKNKRVVSYLWYLPAVLFGTGCLIGWIKFHYFSDLKYCWTWMLFQHVQQILSLLFAGLWTKAMTASGRSAPEVQPIYGAPEVQPIYSAPAPAPDSWAPAERVQNDPRYAGQPPAPAAGPRFCGKCGGRVVPGSPFCPGCGAPLQGPRT